MSDLTYRSAGVDLDLYQQAMQKLPAIMSRTHAAQGGRVLPLPGGFAGLFRLTDEARRYRDPVLVSGTDGVGTKIKVAIAARKYDTVGIDLVGMCVNDCLCLGAEPLFFLDYVALGKDDPQLIAELVAGVSEGCVRAKSALIGGETAIMPDLYAAGDFDMAGFSVGVVERENIVDGRSIVAGDIVIGLASSGLHSNGYSLVRKVVFESAGLAIQDDVPELGKSVADVLLEPTRIYADPVSRLMSDEVTRRAVHGMAHITGGGLAENIARIIPESARCRIHIQRGSWNIPAVFGWLQKLGPVDVDEMFRVFNMGIGYVLVISAESLDRIQLTLNNSGIASHVIGKVAAGERGGELID
ncbi:MAG: phosphoribosylformylglycinamidine cyclo-ligase [Planctomycetaceae bacterium]